jgi:hypothetical protein
VFAPAPMARASTATIAKRGDLVRERTACLKSVSKAASEGLDAGGGEGTGEANAFKDDPECFRYDPR